MVMFMKKVVVLSLLFVCMRGNAEAAVEPSPLAAAKNDNDDSATLLPSEENLRSSGKAADASVRRDIVTKDEASGGRSKAPVADRRGAAMSSTGDAADTAVTPVDASATPSAMTVKEQWVESLKIRNPFIPFGMAPAKAPEKEEKKADDWASKKADELNLYSVTKYPTYTEVSIEVIETRKRCWVRSDIPSDKVPFLFVSYDEKGKILTVKNTVTGEVMDIRQQEKKKETSRGSRSSYDYDGGSSYYDDDFLFNDFDD